MTDNETQFANVSNQSLIAKTKRNRLFGSLFLLFIYDNEYN